MSEFGTPVFDERWRKRGFFAAVDEISASAKVSPDSYRRLNAHILRDAIAELRKELAKTQAALDRVTRNVQPAVGGGKIDQAQLEQNIVALCGWIASSVETLGTLTYYLSEPGLTKAHRMIKQQAEFGNHPSRIRVPAP